MGNRPCSSPRCPYTNPCPVHTRIRESLRGRPAARGYDTRHRRWRTMVLHRFPYCVVCGDVATVADHIVPLRAGGEWTLENGQGLCLSCHNAKAAKELKQFGVRLKQP
jgi:5-methylcytosine-specific restriction protein A